MAKVQLVKTLLKHPITATAISLSYSLIEKELSENEKQKKIRKEGMYNYFAIWDASKYFSLDNCTRQEIQAFAVFKLF